MLTHGQQVVNEAKIAKYVNAWVWVLSKVAKIIGGSRVAVVVEDRAGIARMKDGTIYITKNFLESLTVARQGDHNRLRSAIVSLKGIVYHELSHWLYSPEPDLALDIVNRTRDKIEVWLANEGHTSPAAYALRQQIFDLLNVLEDQRIETTFAIANPAARSYFRANVINIIYNGSPDSAWILLAGRRFTPAKVRKTAKNAWATKYGTSAAEDWGRVADAYVREPIPSTHGPRSLTAERHATLLFEAWKVLYGVHIDPSDDFHVPQPADHQGVEDRQPTDKTTEQVEDLSRQVNSHNDANDEDAPEDSTGNGKSEGSSDDDGEDGDGDGADGADGDDADDDADEAGSGSDGDDDADDGSGDGSGDGDSDDASDTGKSGSDAKGRRPSADGAEDDSQSRSKGAGGGTARTPQRQVQQVLAEDLSQVLNDVAEDADKLLDQVQRVSQSRKAVPYSTAKERTKSLDADQHARNAAKSIKKRISKIRQGLEPEKLTRQTSGRLNVRQFVNRQPTALDFFDSSSEDDTDEGGLEVVAIIDGSSSMKDRQYDASQAAWAIKAGFGSLPDSEVTVLGFRGNHTFSIYNTPDEPRESEVATLAVGGGTNPIGALDMAEAIFALSQKRSKVLIIFTDGGFDSGDTTKIAEGQIDNLNKQGVVTAIFGVDDAVADYGLHNAQVGLDVPTVAQLPQAANELVASIVKRLVAQLKGSPTR